MYIEFGRANELSDSDGLCNLRGWLLCSSPSVYAIVVYDYLEDVVGLVGFSCESLPISPLAGTPGIR
ncbi:hypothetical protein BH10CYA1_BH10CYA1_19050 [soil metagenome]